MSKAARFDYVDDYLDQFSKQSPADFIALRQQAAKNLQAYGFPGLKTENWKYTNAASLLKQCYQIAADSDLTADQLKPWFLPGAQQIVFINGFYHAELSKINASGITISPMNLAATSEQETINEHLGSVISMQQPGFIALNTLFFQQACLLKINTVLTEPLHILNITTALDSDTMIPQRQLIVLEENAAADIIQQYISFEPQLDYWRNNVSEIFLAADTKLSYYKLQDETKQAKHTDFITVKQGRYSVYKHFNFDFGGQLVRNDLQTNLQALAATCELNGLSIAKQQQHIDNHTAIEHNHSKTYSKEYYKSILADRARVVFNGRVVVQQAAQKIKSAQKNANLLLSNQAQVDTKPELEIYADDVVCAHGATVGQLSEKAIFYLQSRGLSEKLAKKLLTYGFAYEILEEILNSTIRGFMVQHLIEAFPGDTILRELMQ